MFWTEGSIRAIEGVGFGEGLSTGCLGAVSTEKFEI